MFMANGVSRKEMLISTMAAFATTAVGMALIDGVIGLILSALSPYASSFATQYAGWYGLHTSARETLSWLPAASFGERQPTWPPH